MTSSEVTWAPEVEKPEVESAAINGSNDVTLLIRFALKYSRYHGYISVVVCVLGMICSLLVIAVLTRRHMLTSSNYMLTAWSSLRKDLLCVD